MSKKFCVFALLIGLFLLSFFFGGETESTAMHADRSTSLYSDSLDVHFFYGEGCPHCTKVKPFLDEMEQKYPLHIHRYDIYTNRSSISLFDEVCNRYGTERRGVPTIFVSDTYLVGDSTIIADFEDVVKNALDHPTANTIKIEQVETSSQEKTSVSNVPSILTITVAGLVDSISPCSLAILVFLIGARVLVNRKKRILRVGLAFCLSVFIAYFLFGLGLLTIVQLGGFSSIFSLLVGLVAVVVGMFYLKDVFWYRKGGFSMEVPGRLKPVLMKMLKGVASPLGAFLMGFVVTGFELPCTGGPYLFILGQLADGTTRLQAIPLLLYYNFLFVLPLIIVSLLLYSNVFSIGKIRQWNDKNKRLLKLVGGLTMIALGFLAIPTLPILHSIQMFLSIYKVAGLPLLSSILLYVILSHARREHIENRLKGTLLIPILFAIVFIVPSPANLSAGEDSIAQAGTFSATVRYVSDSCPREGAVIKVYQPPNTPPDDPVFGLCVYTDETGYCETTLSFSGDTWYRAYAYHPSPDWPEFGNSLFKTDGDGNGEVTINGAGSYPQDTESCGDSECDGLKHCYDGSPPYVECSSWDTGCDTKKCCQCDGGTQANPTQNYDETQDEDCDPCSVCSGIDTCSSIPCTRIVNQTSPACTTGATYYSTIQSAVDAANSGDDIIVCPGTYSEDVEIISKSLDIRSFSEDSSDTIVDASSGSFSGFEIYNPDASYTNISGFTIRRAPTDAAGIYVYDADNVKISNNNITENNDYGILLESSDFAIIENNDVTWTQYVGNIVLYYASNNTVRYNTISDSGIGIYVDGTGDNNISFNNILDNNYGIYVYVSNSNLIYNNYLSNTNNAYDDSTNYWNTTYDCSSGPSIIGEDCIGGNYWSDYIGPDADGDGIGDTPYPIAGGSRYDYLPLVDITPPKYTDITEPSDPSPYSPEISYDFSIRWTDEVSVDTVVLEFDGVNYTDLTKSGDTYNKTFVGLSNDTYNYIWYANDTRNNWNSTSSLTFTVELHDVAVTSIDAYPKSVPQGQPININVTVENQGDAAETFDVIVYADRNTGDLHYDIGTETVSLNPSESTLQEFVWDTAGVPAGTYYITAEAILPEDADLEDNIARTKVGGICVPYAPSPVDLIGLLIPIVSAILVIALLGAAALGLFKILMSVKLPLRRDSFFCH